MKVSSLPRVPTGLATLKTQRAIHTRAGPWLAALSILATTLATYSSAAATPVASSTISSTRSATVAPIEIDLIDQAPPVVEKVPHVHKYRFGEGVTVSDEGRYSLTLTGYVQPFFEQRTYTGKDNGPPGPNARFRLRRLRLRMVGRAPRQRLSFRLQVDLSGATESGDTTRDFLLDAFIAYNFTRTLKLTFGQRATFTDNRELFMRSHTLQLVERSRLTSAFAAIREFGLFLEDRIRLGQSSHYIRPYFVLTNGDGPNVAINDRGGIKLGGRIDYLPFGLFYNKGQFRQVDIVRELVPRLVIGVSYSHNWGMSSRRGRGSGNIIYLNDADEESLPNFGKFGVDFLFKYRGFSMIGEFATTHASVPDDITQRVRNNGTISTTFDGGVENFVKGRMMLGTVYNIQMGYLLPFNTSIDLRYTHLRANTHSFLNNGTFYNRPNYFTFGLSQYFTDNYGLKIQGSLTFVDAASGSNDRRGAGNLITGDEVIARLMTTLAF